MLKYLFNLMTGVLYEIFFFAMMFSTAAFAEELVLNNYVKMQEALAADNFVSAMSVHKTICDKDLKSFKSQYKDCGKSFKDIDALRESFKNLSQIYIKNGNKKELSKLNKVHCPMASASWMQKEGKIANPYYGKSMLECGEIQK